MAVGWRFNQTLPVADLVAFFLYLELFYQPVRALSGAWESVQEALAGGDRVAELLEEAPEVEDTGKAVALAGRAAGALAFRDVNLRLYRRVSRCWSTSTWTSQPIQSSRWWGRRAWARRRWPA